MICVDCLVDWFVWFDGTRFNLVWVIVFFVSVCCVCVFGCFVWVWVAYSLLVLLIGLVGCLCSLLLPWDLVLTCVFCFVVTELACVCLVGCPVLTILTVWVCF